MFRTRVFLLTATVLFPLIFISAHSSYSSAQEWEIRRPRGTVKVVELLLPPSVIFRAYSEALIQLDGEGKIVPCLAEDWRWLNDRTIEFRLRKAVTFQSGEKFDAEAVRINWEAYKAMKSPRVLPSTM